MPQRAPRLSLLALLAACVLASACGSSDETTADAPADLTPLAAALDSSEGAPDHTAVPDGALMLVGGAKIARVKEFVDLAGGADASIVFVPTAQSAVNLDQWERRAREIVAQAGGSPERVAVLHTRDPNVADLERFTAPLDTADAVWFVGGRQWRLARVYGGTATLDAFRAVLDRGGVIGGSSAGASIQASFLVRGDPESNDVMMGDYQTGFGFLPHSAVDQHLLARNRQYDLIPVIEAHPDLLGIGIDENTALVVRGDTARVTGESKVAIYDHRRWAEADSTLRRDDKFFFLEPGDRLDLRTRQELPPVGRP
jgi:cyanophycinase